MMRKLIRPNFPSGTLPTLVTGAKKRVSDWLASPRPKDFGEPGRKLTPYERYRRQKLFKLLQLENLEGQSVLQVGCGVGDLLLEIAKYKPKELFGVDTSAEEMEIARRRLEEQGIEADLAFITDPALPYPDSSFDTVLMVQQLQHIREGKLLRSIMEDLCRVSRQWLILVEDTGLKRMQRDSYARRTVQYYKNFFLKKKFHLRSTAYMDVAATRSAVRWLSDPWQTLRWIFSPLLYLIGFPRQWLRRPAETGAAPYSQASPFWQKLALWLTAGLDDVVKTGKGTTKMVFERERLFRRG